MAHPLDDPRAKIKRAEHHLDELERERLNWIKSNPYLILPYPKAESDTIVFQLHRFDEAVKIEKDVFGLIIGDYVHNLRSALDHLMWQLVTTANKRKVKDRSEVYFPVGTSFEHFVGLPPLRHVTREQFEVIEDFQPYRGGNAPNPLRDLQRLWNADKHRLVTPIFVRVAEQGPVFQPNSDARIVEQWFDTKVTLQGDAKIACVRIERIGPSPEVHVTALPVDVTFGEGEVPTGGLIAMRDITRDIVNRCARFFS